MGITIFKCPHCKKIINMTDGLQNRMQDIGDPLMKCKFCGGLIKTGAQEWVDLPMSRKIGIWLKIHIVYGVFYGGILGLATWALVVEVFQKSNQLGTILGIIVFLIFFYLMDRGYKNEIQNSQRKKQ